MNLSEAQARALDKLTTKWQSAFKLKAGLDTLDCLCRKGLAERKRTVRARFDLLNAYLYRLKNGGENDSKTS